MSVIQFAIKKEQICNKKLSKSEPKIKPCGTPKKISSKSLCIDPLLIFVSCF